MLQSNTGQVARVRHARGARTVRAVAIFTLMMVVVVIGAACAAPLRPPVAPTAPADEEASAAATDTATDAGVPTYADWGEVLTAAEGTTVNWFLWGGSDTINAHVDEVVGGALEAYGVTLNRVPVENTADAVNKVLNEKAAGVDTGGSIDLIWINGENFRTLKEAGLLYGPFTDLLPNNQYVNWDDPSVAFDFGVPVEGYESPWASFQFVMEYNAATVGDSPPQTYEALAEWVAANPGRFTYPAPPNHVGSAFVRQLFYWAAGSPEPFLGPFDQALFDEVAPQVWDYLNGIEPDLWRGGETYPEVASMADLLANQEIDFAMEYDANRASNFIAQGRYPETIRTFVWETGTVANVSYVAIPYNAANPAGALVLANYLLSPEYQIGLSDPEASLGWMVAIDPTRLSEAEQAQLADAPRGAVTLPPEVLRSAALPETSADWVMAMDEGWAENVLQR